MRATFRDCQEMAQGGLGKKRPFLLYRNARFSVLQKKTMQTRFFFFFVLFALAAEVASASIMLWVGLAYT